MGTIEESIDIHAPVGKVFAGITDPRRTLEWNPNIVGIRDVPEGPVGEGASWNQTMIMAGRPVEVSCTVVRYVPPSEGVLKISGAQSGEVRTRCEQRGRHTHVTQAIDFVPPGKLGMLASVVIGPAIRRELARSLARQREVLEREAGDAYGSGPH
ncbi:MAG: hypothetical protein NVSMB52_09950 [Chloroflexota bacterium]